MGKVHTLLLALGLLALSACGGGGGGSSGGSSGGAGGDTASPVTDVRMVSEASGQVDADQGGAVSLAGARLEAPPGALETSAELGLQEYEVPDGAAVPPAEDEPSPSGQIPLWPTGFVVSVDREVGLRDRLVLELPVDPARVPEGTDPGAFHVSAVILGDLVPQSWPVTYDEEKGVLEVSLPFTRLYPDLSHQMSGAPPQGAAIAFLTVLAVGSQVQPLIATVDDLKAPFMYHTMETDHFKLRYRGQQVYEADARKVLNALEDAYDLFVKDMGFHLPGDWDGQHTMYIDDFSNHVWFTWFGDPEANGVSLPGSFWIEGAGYVNAAKDPAGWPQTAVHEYFHALQYGVLTDVVPNSWYSALYKSSHWLFEGSAAALSARVMAGGDTPARDTTIPLPITQEMALYDPEQGPPPEVAQDFFYFLERRLGGTGFYLDAFQNLGTVSLYAPMSVEAMDQAIRSAGDEQITGMSSAWEEFVADRCAKNPDAYGGPPTPARQAVLSDSGESSTETVTLPPLSYAVVQYGIPRFSADTPQYNQPSTVKIVLRGEPGIYTFACINAKKGADRLSSYPFCFHLRDEREELTVEGVRDAEHPSYVWVILGNNRLSGDPVSLTLEARLRAVEESEHKLAYAFEEQDASGTSIAVGIRVMDTETGETWLVTRTALDASVAEFPAGLAGDGTLLSLGAGSDRVMWRPNWGLGLPVDLKEVCELEDVSGIGAIEDDGTAVLVGTQVYATEHDPLFGEVEKRRTGLFRASMDWCAFVPVDTDGDGAWDNLSVDSLAIARDGSVVVVVDGENRLAAVDPFDGTFRVLATGMAKVHAVSANGAVCLAEDEQGRLWAVSVHDGSRVELVAFDEDLVPLGGRYADLSPDGRWVVVSAFSLESGRLGLLKVETDGTGAGWLDTGLLIPGDARFTPDSRFVVFSAATASNPTASDLYILDLEGSEGPRQLTNTPQVSEYMPVPR